MNYNYRHIAFHIIGTLGRNPRGEKAVRRKVSHFIGLAIIAAFIAYPVIRFGLDALESTAIVFF